MAALLVGMSMMAVLMGAALPSWTQMAQREREEEYLFRATQYARAIRLWQDKNGMANVPAPSIEVLVEGRFLRKKYLDPITGKEFRLLQNAPAPAAPGGPSPTKPGQSNPSTPAAVKPGAGVGSLPRAGAQPPSGVFGSPTAPTAQAGGFIGVTSTSKEQGLKLFKGAETTYDQWAFTYMDVPGLQANPGGTNRPGGNQLFPVNQNPSQQGGSPFSPTGANPKPSNLPAPPGNPFGQPAPPAGPGSFGQPTPFGTPVSPIPPGQPTRVPFGTPPKPPK